MNAGRLANRTCLVTGASRGLGAAVAKRLWSEGANLVLAVRTPESVSALLPSPAGTPGQTAVALPFDLHDLESVRTLVPRIMERGVESLDVLINNAAALGPVGKAWENPPDEWAATISADLVSPALLCAAVVPWMSRHGGGKIINLSGGGSTGPRPAFSAYGAAKAGLVRFSETLAAEVAELGISVNCVAPGAMGTDMLAAVQRAGDAAGDKELAAASKALAAGDATMRAAVDLIAFLASDESDGVTGKLVSAVWDDWRAFPARLAELRASDVFTLRRIAGRDRGMPWCDK